MPKLRPTAPSTNFWKVYPNRNILLHKCASNPRTLDSLYSRQSTYGHPFQAGGVLALFDREHLPAARSSARLRADSRVVRWGGNELKGRVLWSAGPYYRSRK